MEVATGDKFKTASGRDVRIICIDRKCPGGYPILALIKLNEEEEIVVPYGNDLVCTNHHFFPKEDLSIQLGE